MTISTTVAPSQPEATFDLIFRGQLTKTTSVEQAQVNLAQLFKMPPDKVAALFRGGPVTLKKGLSAEAAQRYQAAIAKAGAVVEIVPSRWEAPLPLAQNPQVTPQIAHTPAKTPPHVQPDQAPDSVAWSLSDAGRDLLTASERVAHVSRLDEFVDFDLRPSGGNLIDRDEVAEIAAPVVQVPNFDLAPAGADVLTAAERQPPARAQVVPGNWQVAPVGERLSVPKAQPPVAPDVGHLSLQK